MSFTTQQIGLLRQDLDAAGYSAAAINELFPDRVRNLVLGGEPAEARYLLSRRCEISEALAIFVRLFVLGDEISATEGASALPNLGVETACSCGLLSSDGENVRAALSLNAERLELLGTQVDLLLLSDLDDHLRSGPAVSDHVTGVGGATRSLLRQLPVAEYERIAEVGCGSGAVTLALASLGYPVTASDISDRALALAKANADLNGIKNVEFVAGDLCAPFNSDKYDLVLSNPPFVIAPQGATALTYRSAEAGGGDQLVGRLLKEIGSILTPGGLFVGLLSWENHWGGDFSQKPAHWLEAAHENYPLDTAWVIERERLTPGEYARMWLRDGGELPSSESYLGQFNDYLADFASREVTSLSFGTVHLRSSAEPPASTISPILRIEPVSAPGAAALGNAIGQVLALAPKLLRLTDAELASARLISSSEVQEQRLYRLGMSDPHKIYLAIPAPFARQHEVDTLTAALLGASDGELTVQQIAAALGEIFEVDEPEVLSALLEAIRELAWLGVFTGFELH